ncbi:PD-(D/E)XK nuclease family protein [bacterium]|nr:PD-(D/E)XK nuclease family protein [bacterium]
MKTYPNYSFTSILGWSVSRYETFKNCKRAYYYNYYGKYDEQVPVDVINDLKKLTSIPLEKGNITHDIIRDILIRYTKTSANIDRVKLFTYIHKMIKSYCNKKVFSEVYYKQITKIDLEEIFNEVKQAVINLFNSNRFKWLISKAMESKQEWIIEPGGFGETRFNDLKAYCKVDYFFPLGDEYYILDWKTGHYAPEKHRKQMLAYALWAKDTYQLTSEQINPILAFLLPNYLEIGEPFTLEELTQFNQVIHKETQEMHSFCANIEDNIPLVKDNFPQTDKYIICSFCNFRKLCNLSNL